MEGYKHAIISQTVTEIRFTGLAFWALWQSKKKKNRFVLNFILSGSIHLVVVSMTTLSKPYCLCMFLVISQWMLMMYNLQPVVLRGSPGVLPSSMKISHNQMFTRLGTMEHSTNGSRPLCPIWDHVDRNLLSWDKGTKVDLCHPVVPFLLEF